MSIELLYLLVIYQLKHFLCDYPLQTPYMLKKFSRFPDYIFPLMGHAGVHGFATFLICKGYLFLTDKHSLSLALLLGVADMAIHFIVDRIKASPRMLGRFKPLSASEFFGSTEIQRRHNKYFWWSLGADQMAHHLTHYWIIWTLLSFS